MEWVEKLNQSMKYIEEHLTDEIDYEQLGRIACSSGERQNNYAGEYDDGAVYVH